MIIMILNFFDEFNNKWSNWWSLTLKVRNFSFLNWILYMKLVNCHLWIAMVLTIFIEKYFYFWCLSTSETALKILPPSIRDSERDQRGTRRKKKRNIDWYVFYVLTIYRVKNWFNASIETDCSSNDWVIYISYVYINMYA